MRCMITGKTLLSHSSNITQLEIMQTLPIHKYVLHLDNFDMLYKNIHKIIYEALKIMRSIRLERQHLKIDKFKMAKSHYIRFVTTCLIAMISPTIKCDISILSENSINLIIKMMVIFCDIYSLKNAQTRE